MTDIAALEQAFRRAQRLPDGDAKVAELERVVEHADALEQERLGFDARMALIVAYQEHTEVWRMLTPFGWCLAAYDREPGRFDDDDAEMLRWYHKWAVSTLRKTPRVGLAQIGAALDDMERRFREGGHSPQAVFMLRCLTARHLGDQEETRAWLARWRTAPRDENSDCTGCDPYKQARVLAWLGDLPAAVDVLEPVLSGAVGCPEQPEKALAGVMIPYLRLGRHDDAARAHVRAYRRHRFERDDFDFLADHLAFCVLAGHHERGLEILAEHLPWYERPSTEKDAMDFAAAGAAVCALAVARGHGEQVVPEAAVDGADVTVAQLGTRLATQARELARRFDVRNLTHEQSRGVERALALAPLVDHLDLPPDLPVSPGTVGAPPVGQHDDVLAPVSLAALQAVLDEQGYRYAAVDEELVGVWGEAQLRFWVQHEPQPVLCIRAVSQRTLPAERLDEAYAFCNDWNHRTLGPTAYVHEVGDGQVRVVGDSFSAMAHGASARQLKVIVEGAIGAGASMAEAVDDLP